MSLIRVTSSQMLKSAAAQESKLVRHHKLAQADSHGHMAHKQHCTQPGVEQLAGYIAPTRNIASTTVEPIKQVPTRTETSHQGICATNLMKGLPTTRQVELWTAGQHDSCSGTCSPTGQDSVHPKPPIGPQSNSGIESPALRREPLRSACACRASHSQLYTHASPCEAAMLCAARTAHNIRDRPYPESD